MRIKNLLKLDYAFLTKLESRIRGWIKDDMIRGEMQAPNSFNYSKQYAKYKRKGMKTKKGKNLASLRGQGVHSTHASSVNMYLTGDLIAGLHADKKKSSARSSYVVMRYDKKDEVKLIGNIKYADYILTLSKKNIKKAMKLITNELNKRLRLYAKQKIIIRV
jgi:hypothetical protein